MSQNVVATTEKTHFAAAPLAEVTKSRTSLENTLNNNGKAKKAAQQSKTTAKASQPKGAANRGNYPAHGKPWSTMSPSEVAEVVKKHQEEEDDEDAIMPSRRRAPPPRGAATTVTSYTTASTTTTAAAAVPSTPVKVQAPSLSRGNRGAQASFYAASPAPKQQQQQRQRQFSFPQQPAAPVFDQQSYAPRHGSGSATPPSMEQDYSQDYAQQVQETPVHEEEPYLVSMFRHDPYAFNVLGDNLTREASSSTPMAYHSAAQGGPMDTSFYSESDASTVGYVHSAEVSPVKNHAQGTLYNEQRRAHVTAMASYHQWPLTETSGCNSPVLQHQPSFSEASSAVAPTTAATAPKGKVKRVYVNGRPVITPQ